MGVCESKRERERERGLGVRFVFEIRTQNFDDRKFDVWFWIASKQTYFLASNQTFNNEFPSSILSLYVQFLVI